MATNEILYIDPLRGWPPLKLSLSGGHKPCYFSQLMLYGAFLALVLLAEELALRFRPHAS